MTTDRGTGSGPARTGRPDEDHLRDPTTVARGVTMFSITMRLVTVALPGAAEVPWLLLQNGVAILLYVVCWFWIARGSRPDNLMLLVIGPEWLLWSLSMVAAFGLDTGFQLFGLLFLSVAILLFDRFGIRHRLLLAIAPLLVYAPLTAVVARSAPAIDLAAGLRFWLATANQIAITAVVLVIAVAALRDQARARREAERREVAQAQLVEDLSHELRTPLATVLTAAQAAQAPNCSADQHRQIAGRIERSARSMGRLVERMLDLATLEHGLVRAEDDAEVCEVVVQAVEEVQALAAARRIELGLELGSTSRRTSSASLGVVLRNLLTNAIHHSPDGGRIEVRLVGGAAGTSIEVEDHGDGIAAEDLPRIYDRLWRADNARTGGGGRHGLGLALARRHAELVGATLAVRSEVGQGTVFTVGFR